MKAFIFILLYVTMFAWLIRRAPYFRQSGIPTTWLIGLLCIKIVVGVLYGWIHAEFFAGGDTLLYFAESQRIANTFWEYPSYYMYSLLGYDMPVPSENVFTYPPTHLFWRDLGTYAIIHFNAILMPFSRGLYEIHVVFMAMLSLCAGVNLHRVLRRSLRVPPYMLIAGAFLLPSLLFWTAGVHQDVFLLFGLSLILLGMADKRWLLGMAGVLIVGLTRYYALALLIPAASAYIWAHREGRYRWLQFGALWAALVGCIFLIDHLYFDNQFINLLANRQQAFLNEVGGSRIEGVPAFGSLWEMLAQIPHGFINVVMRPFLWECENSLQRLAALEIIAAKVIFINMLLFFKRRARFTPMFYFMLVFAVGYLLLIGLLVANEGTIVRYRAVPLSLLIVLMWHCTDFVAMRRFFNKLVLPTFNRFKTYP